MAIVTVVYCHSCQGWIVYSSLATQQDDEDPLMALWYEDHLGPFDQPVDAHRLALAHLDEFLFSSGRPWDHQHASPTGALELHED